MPRKLPSRIVTTLPRRAFTASSRFGIPNRTGREAPPQIVLLGITARGTDPSQNAPLFAGDASTPGPNLPPRELPLNESKQTPSRHDIFAQRDKEARKLESESEESHRIQVHAVQMRLSGNQGRGAANPPVHAHSALPIDASILIVQEKTRRNGHDRDDWNDAGEGPSRRHRSADGDAEDGFAKQEKSIGKRNGNGEGGSERATRVVEERLRIMAIACLAL